MINVLLFLAGCLALIKRELPHRRPLAWLFGSVIFVILWLSFEKGFGALYLIREFFQFPFLKEEAAVLSWQQYFILVPLFFSFFEKELGKKSFLLLLTIPLFCHGANTAVIGAFLILNLSLKSANNNLFSVTLFGFLFGLNYFSTLFPHQTEQNFYYHLFSAILGILLLLKSCLCSPREKESLPPIVETMFLSLLIFRNLEALDFAQPGVLGILWLLLCLKVVASWRREVGKASKLLSATFSFYFLSFGKEEFLLVVFAASLVAFVTTLTLPLSANLKNQNLADPQDLFLCKTALFLSLVIVLNFLLSLHWGLFVALLILVLLFNSQINKFTILLSLSTSRSPKFFSLLVIAIFTETFIFKLTGAI